ncbi:hypothetical protein [Caldivirga sp.]|uniref:hypothetical protein n=1 Tax=Caldivirga sp. TaxID=2080243 RepID=UPI0025BF6655|nr:hypothetical protein [Caldivirga sp.]
MPNTIVVNISEAVELALALAITLIMSLVVISSSKLPGNLANSSVDNTLRSYTIGHH